MKSGSYLARRATIRRILTTLCDRFVPKALLGNFAITGAADGSGRVLRQNRRIIGKPRSDYVNPGYLSLARNA